MQIDFEEPFNKEIRLLHKVHKIQLLSYPLPYLNNWPVLLAAHFIDKLLSAVQQSFMPEALINLVNADIFTK